MEEIRKSSLAYASGDPGFLSGHAFLAENQLVPGHVNLDDVLRSELPGQDFLRQGIFHMLLNGAFERPCAKYRIETGLGQLVQCPRGKLDIHLACAQPGTQVLYLEFGDTMQLFAT